MADSYGGRLLDHVHLRVSDLSASRQFYGAIVDVLGLPIRDGEGWFSVDELFVSDDGPPTLNAHLAFQAADEVVVRQCYEAGLAAGGKDNGAPGERSYHPGYYSAYLLDPDGTNVEAVYHGPHTRSADAIEYSWT